MTYQFRKPARPVRRIFIHCSASDRPEHDSAAVIDAWHKAKGWAGIGYHFFIQKKGTLELGRDLEKIPAAQEGNNTGTIAICLHGLQVDKFTDAQFRTLRTLCDQINRAYGGDLTFHGHCEVAAKTCPVFVYDKVLGIDTNGKLPLADSAHGELSLPDVDFGGLEVLSNSVTVLKLGMKGEDIRSLQSLLTRLGYHLGEIDGDFGKRTRAAVMAFQADNDLEPDGKVGSLTRAALGQAVPREVAPKRAAMTLAGLASGGSRIAKASIGNGMIGALLGGGGAVAILDQLTGAVSQVTGQADAIERLIAEHGIVTGGVILAAGAFVAFQSWRAGRARVEDHRSGKTS